MIRWPERNDTDIVTCPNCKGDRAFTDPVSPPNGNNGLQYQFDNGPNPVHSHVVKARFCRSCGFPIIRHEHGPVKVPADRKTMLYPQAPTREKCGELIRTADNNLANDYDEAVECEPMSCTAAMMLLGRCLNRILINKAECSTKLPLGPMIDDAIERNEIPTSIQDDLKDGFLHARNMTNHIWFDEEGTEIQVENADVDHCFELIKALFESLYIAPARMAARTDRLKEKRQQKTT